MVNKSSFLFNYYENETSLSAPLCRKGLNFQDEIILNCSFQGGLYTKGINRSSIKYFRGNYLIREQFNGQNFQHQLEMSEFLSSKVC